MDARDEQKIRQHFDDYLRMYSSRDDRLTEFFSVDFSGFTGGGDFLVKDRDEWIAITRQDFAQVKEPLRIELLDLSIQSLAETIAVATGFFHIHLPIEDLVLSRETARLVLIFRQEPGGWKICHSSISIPYNLVREGEVYPLQKLEESHRILEEQVAERTRQLSEVNATLQQVNERLAKEIAEHKKSEEALQESEAHFRLLAENVSDVVWKLDSDYHFTYISPSDERLRGFRADEVLGQHIFEIFDDDGIATVKKFADQRQQAELKGEKTGSLRFEALHRCKDGSWLWAEVSASPERDTDGTVIGYYGISREITERKNAEQTLQHERNLSMDIINAQSAGIYRIRVFATETWENDAWRNSWSSPHVVELASEPFCKILGTTKEAFVSRPGMIVDLIYPDDREDFARENEEAVLREKFIWEGRLCIDGVIRWVRFESLPRPLENGDVLWTGVLIDINDRIKAEKEKYILESQLQRAQKLESLGVLSGGIAHDFNNILAIIMGYCGLTKLDLETAEKNIAEIEKAVERAAGLCRQMLAYAGKAQLTKTRINLVEKVGEIVSMLKSTLPKNAAIMFDNSTNIPFIIADASQLGQVVMNLIINAAEAIGTEQGEVHVSLARIKIDSGKACEDYHCKAIPTGAYVCLEVTDNGCGMDETTKWRIFEPFYTTKFTGRGLGLSAVLGIIKSHAGALQLYSQPGHGTTFKVYLPALASEAAGDEVQSASAPAAPWQGSGTILLAEDEAQVRHIAKELLEMLGFSVLEAVNGKEALDIYLKYATEITLVVTDMGMPVMDGYELFSELKKLNPQLPIIVSSGYGDAEVSSRIGTDKIAGIISKPYSTDQLREVLKSVVEGTAPTNA